MATIRERYTVIGSVTYDPAPITPPTPRYQVTIQGGYINEDGVTQLTVDEGTTVTLIPDLPTSMQYPRFDHFAVEGGRHIGSLSVR